MSVLKKTHTFYQKRHRNEFKVIKRHFTLYILIQSSKEHHKTIED